jgi:exonuclease SbcC
MKNFMNHSESEIDCTLFNSCLIVGKNRKNEFVSNGVGKTTIFNAIEYALFNKSHATNLDKIIKDGQKKVIVEFEFELSGDIYKIYRHRTSSGSVNLELYQKTNNEWVPLSEKTPAETDVKLKTIIKISHKSFTYSVLFRQADLTGITNVEEPAKRIEILKEPMNLAPYSKMQKLAEGKLTPLNKEVTKLESSIVVLGNPDEDIQKANEELITISSDIEKQKKIISDISAAIESKQGTIDHLKISLSSEDADIHKRVSEQDLLLKKAKDLLKSQEEKLKSLNDLLLKRDVELKKLEKNIEDDSKKLSLLPTTNNIEELNTIYKKVCADELSGSELLAAVNAQIKFTKNTLPDGDVCPSCKQSITTDYRNKIANDISISLLKQQEQSKVLEDNLGKCRRKKLRLEEELKTARSNANEISRLENNIKSTNNEIKSKREDIDRLYADQKDSNKTISESENNITNITQTLDNLKEAAGKSNAPEINKQIFKITQEITDQKTNLSTSNSRISSLSSIKGGLEERVSTRSNDKVKIKDYKDSLIKTKRELKIKQMVVEAYKGIPGQIIQTIINDLQFEANKALRDLRPELEVCIDADLNFEYRRNGIIREYKQLSHGQHVYIAMAFKYGLSRVLQTRQNINIRLLVLDECDAHLDEAGVNAFADCIAKWQKDFTIFVITHNKDLKDKFSHAIVVEEGEDGSEAHVTSSW